MKNIADIRTDYKLGNLDESAIDQDPFIQFSKWWSEAIHSNIEEPNAMILSTVNSAGYPSSRTVLVKDFSAAGFVFYTNYNSHKGEDILSNPHVSLLFFWKELQRQVRINGIAQKTDALTSDTYFASRPRDSRIAAWASDQSIAVSGRADLDQRIEYFNDKFEGQDIPRPPHWGGYLVVPQSIEFWQGRSNRMHDRLKYTMNNNTWVINRLAP